MAACICDSPNRCTAMDACRRKERLRALEILPPHLSQDTVAASNVIRFTGKKPNATTLPRKA
jgi:hypothetical protein